MNISTIQKRKFLNNLYKLFYSSGTRPNEQEVRRVFGQYFSINKLGEPVPVEYNLLQQQSIVREQDLNSLMAATALNLEVLYDSINENNLELFDIITALNNRFANLRAKRKELEAKVDDLIFANGNSEGYFYSFTDTFSSLINTDLTKTNAFIDTELSSVSLPRLVSSPSISELNKISTGNVSARILDNGVGANLPVSLEGIENAFDGLNDTYWQVSYQSNSISIVTLEISIPLSSNSRVSRIAGRLQSSTPLIILVEAIPLDPNIVSTILVRDSSVDYNYFNFYLPSFDYQRIIVRLVKKDPDYINTDTSDFYNYLFGVREFFISSEYYDNTATYISSPISVPSSDNSLIYIDSVSLSVKDQIPEGTSINYYVSANNPTATSAADFDWTPISPVNYEQKSFPSIVNLVSPSYTSRYIKSNPANPEDIKLIGLRDVGSVNELNPNINIYSGKKVYMIATVDKYEQFLSPSILSSVGSFRRYFREYSRSYKSLDRWAEEIRSINSIIGDDILYFQEKSISPGTRIPCSGYISGKVNSKVKRSGIHNVTKSRDDFDVAVYLNGSLIADLPSGTLSKEIEWTFVKGVNDIVITYDKEFSGDIILEPLGGSSVNLYGDLYLNRFTYLDPIEFRNRLGIQSDIFTIDTVLGTKYILSSEYLGEVSIINYYKNSRDLVDSVRVRADLYRYQDPLVSPSIDEIKVLFKHIDD
jgi:hypothetical protein